MTAAKIDNFIMASEAAVILVHDHPYQKNIENNFWAPPPQAEKRRPRGAGNLPKPHCDIWGIPSPLRPNNTETAVA